MSCSSYLCVCVCVCVSRRVTITEATSPQGAAGDAVGDRERVWGGQAVQLRYINRDGLAALLGYTQAPLGIPYVLIDLRRHDERTLYGTIRGSVHVPGRLNGDWTRKHACMCVCTCVHILVPVLSTKHSTLMPLCVHTHTPPAMPSASKPLAMEAHEGL